VNTQSKNTDLLAQIESYYAEKLAKYGNTPQGVDWKDEESQTIRFNQLFKIFQHNQPKFSVNDLGCGYGALLEILRSQFPKSLYTGFDISRDMIVSAEKKYAAMKQKKFIISSIPNQSADYGIASGIFNVKQNRNETEWLHYIVEILDALDKTSSIGFAFNCLTSYSDENKKRASLFYANPCFMFDLCKTRYSKNVALLHDYDLYEFTILVKKK